MAKAPRTTEHDNLTCSSGQAAKIKHAPDSNSDRCTRSAFFLLFLPNPEAYPEADPRPTPMLQYYFFLPPPPAVAAHAIPSNDTFAAARHYYNSGVGRVDVYQWDSVSSTWVPRGSPLSSGSAETVGRDGGGDFEVAKVAAALTEAVSAVVSAQLTSLIGL